MDKETENTRAYRDVWNAVSGEYDKALDYEKAADTDTSRSFCAGMSEAYKHVLDIFAEREKPASMTIKDCAFMKDTLERMVRKERPNLELAGMTHDNGTLTGYFVPSATAAGPYVHIWEIHIDLEARIIYSDTLRELMLVPIDGYEFPDDVFFTVNTRKLKEMGFYIPTEAKK
jgi:hypothetical protein